MTEKGEAVDETAAIAPSPARQRVVAFRGEQVTVAPLKVGRLPAFVAALRPVLAELVAMSRAGEEVGISVEKVLDWIERYTDNLVNGVAAATGKTADAVGAGEPDEFLELALAVLSVNMDFFVRRLLPLGARLNSTLVGALREIGSGRTPSKD